MTGDEKNEVLNTDHVLCANVLTDFYRYLDAGDIEGLSDLMHPEFLWLRQGKELRSREDLAVALPRDPRLHIFHILNALQFGRLTGDHLRYSGYLLVLRGHAEPAQAVQMPPSGAQSLHVCAGELRRTTDGWRISAMNAGQPRLLLDL